MDTSTELSYELFNSVTTNNVNNQITFEIPGTNDLEHIQHLDRFSNLLHRILPANSVIQNDMGQLSGVLSADGSIVNKDEISGSVVLDLADLQSRNGLYEFFFGDMDTQAVFNMMWVGIVVAFLILSITFLLFSCYFYRKFMEWKKCDKDIRAQVRSNGCSSTTPNKGPSESDYYQIESPPCYTIASGLPTYDEALNHTSITMEHPILPGLNVFLPKDYFCTNSSSDNYSFQSPNEPLDESTCSSTSLLTDVVVIS